MKAHNLKRIVDEIIFKTGMTQEEIAQKIGYERPYFSSVINNPEKNGTRIEGRLRAEFSEIVEPMYNTTVTSKVVKPASENNDRVKELERKVQDLERKLAEVKAQLDLIISLMRK